MIFNIKKPCPDCPFRKDRPGYLTPRRARKIVNATFKQDAGVPFHCHKTVEYDEDGGASKTQPVLERQFCAGALILAEKQGIQNQAMQIGERLGFYKPDELRGHELVHETCSDFIKHCS